VRRAAKSFVVGAASTSSTSVTHALRPARVKSFGLNEARKIITVF
jgi:hypothetical protein